MPRFFRRLAEGVFDEADVRLRAAALARLRRRPRATATASTDRSPSASRTARTSRGGGDAAPTRAPSQEPCSCAPCRPCRRRPPGPPTARPPLGPVRQHGSDRARRRRRAPRRRPRGRRRRGGSHHTPAGEPRPDRGGSHPRPRLARRPLRRGRAEGRRGPPARRPHQPPETPLPPGAEPPAGGLPDAPCGLRRRGSNDGSRVRAHLPATRPIEENSHGPRRHPPPDRRDRGSGAQPPLLHRHARAPGS